MSNAAQRIHSLLEKALSTVPSSDRACWDVWPEVGGVDSKSVPQQQRETWVFLFLAEVREQIDLAEQEAEKIPRLAPALQKALTNARNFTSPSSLPTPWRNNIGNHLMADVMTAWQMAAITMPVTEKLNDNENPLAGVRKAIDELEAAAAESQITDELRDLLNAQVATLRKALHLYEIAGAAAIEKAVERVAGAIFVHKDVLARSSDGDEKATEKTYKRVVSAIGNLAKWCRDAMAIQGAVVLGHQAASHALPELQQLLSNLGP